MWDNLNNRTATVAAIVYILIATPTALYGAYVAVFGDPFAPNAVDVAADAAPPVLAARELARCMQRHHLPTRHVQIETPRDGDLPLTVFKRCDWPSPSGVSFDGYTAIVDDASPISGPNHGAADEFSELHTLSAPCDDLVLTFELVHMNARTFADVHVPAGRVVGATYSRRRPITAHLVERIPEGVSIPTTSRNFYALVNGHMILFDAACSN
jgi:hypothetical protein